MIVTVLSCPRIKCCVASQIRIAGSSKVQQNLVCRRRLTLLMRETRTISGHMATLTVYEEVSSRLLRAIQSLFMRTLLIDVPSL